MCGSMVDIQSATAEIRRGKKEEGKKPQGKNIMSASATQGGHKKLRFIHTVDGDRPKTAKSYKCNINRNNIA